MFAVMWLEGNTTIFFTFPKILRDLEYRIYIYRQKREHRKNFFYLKIRIQEDTCL